MHINKLWMGNTTILLSKTIKTDIDIIPMEIIEDTRIMNILTVRIGDHRPFTLINHRIILGTAS